MEVSNRARKPTHPPGTAPPYLRISEIAPQLQMSSIQNDCFLIVHWFKIRLNSNAKRQQRLVYAGEVCLAMTNETQPYFICIYRYVYIYINIYTHLSYTHTYIPTRRRNDKKPFFVFIGKLFPDTFSQKLFFLLKIWSRRTDHANLIRLSYKGWQ